MDPVSRASVLLPLVAVLRCHVQMAHPVMQAMAPRHAKAFVQLEFAARIVRFFLQQVRAGEILCMLCGASAIGTVLTMLDHLSLALKMRLPMQHAAAVASAILRGLLKCAVAKDSASPNKVAHVTSPAPTKGARKLVVNHATASRIVRQDAGLHTVQCMCTAPACHFIARPAPNINSCCHHTHTGPLLQQCSW
jgi:hypothetical protein